MASSTSAAAHRLGELHDHGAVERRGRRVEVAGGVTVGHVLREVAPPALHPQLIDRHAEGDEHVGYLLGPKLAQRPPGLGVADVGLPAEDLPDDGAVGQLLGIWAEDLRDTAGIEQSLLAGPETERAAGERQASGRAREAGIDRD